MGVLVLCLLFPLVLLALLLAMERVERPLREDALNGGRATEAEPLADDAADGAAEPRGPRRRLARLIPGLSR